MWRALLVYLMTRMYMYMYFFCVDWKAEYTVFYAVLHPHFLLKRGMFVYSTDTYS